MRRFIHPREIGSHPDAVYIGREHAGRGRGPSFKRSPWANPWKWRKVGRARAVELLAKWITGDEDAAALLPPGRWPRPSVDAIRRDLAGRTLACWCPAGEPCHGHVLAEIASGTAATVGAAGLDTRKRLRFHQIRRSAASHFAAAGGEAVEMLDHSSPKITNRWYLDPRLVDRGQRPCDILPPIFHSSWDENEDDDGAGMLVAS